MECLYKMPHPLYYEKPADCHFELVSYREGERIHKNDIQTHSLVFCQTGHLRISCTLFHDEILCAGEIMFLSQ